MFSADYPDFLPVENLWHGLYCHFIYLSHFCLSIVVLYLDYVLQVSVEGRSGLPGSVQHGSTNSATRSGDIESILRVSKYRY